MCEAATIATLVAMAASTYVAYDAQKSASKKQERAVRDAEQEQSTLNGQRQNALMQAVNGYLDKTPGQQAQQAQQGRLEGVAAESVATASQARPDDGMSIDYTKDKATRAASEARRAITQAMETSKAQAPQTTMFESGLGLADDLSEVDGIASQMRRAASRSQNNIRRAGQVNAGQMALAGAISGGAGAYSSSTTRSTRQPGYPTNYQGP